MHGMARAIAKYMYVDKVLSHSLSLAPASHVQSQTYVQRSKRP